MRRMFFALSCFFAILVTACDSGHGHSHGDNAPKLPDHHKSIESTK